MILDLFVLGTIGVAAITSILTANTTAWGSPTVIAVWVLIPVVFIIAVVYHYMPKKGSG